jgi:hypothetical protein
MGYIAAGILFFTLYHVFIIMLKVTKKEQDFIKWVNKND